MIKKILLAFILSPLLTGCGSITQSKPEQAQSQILSADDIFDNQPGTWTFKNKLGDTTTIEKIRVDENHSIWHYTKSAGRAYWAPPAENAELWFDLERDSTHAWYSTGGVVNEPGIAMTRYVVTQKPGQPRPYLILPARADFSYTAIFDDQLPSGTDAFIIAKNTEWKTSGYMEDVVTPVYSGPAYVSDQFEGPCIHEKWYFAPKIGMVKIMPVAQKADCAPGSSPYDATTVDVITTYRQP